MLSNEALEGDGGGRMRTDVVGDATVQSRTGS